VKQVPISSTKPFVGHTLGAAGAIEAVACILAINEGMLPPTLHFEADGPVGENEFDFVPNVARPHPVTTVVSNNYAFGGNNASIVFAKPGLYQRQPVHAERRVYLTGIGPVGSLGVGLDAWRDAFRHGVGGLGPITSFDASKYQCQYAGEMCALDGRGFASPGEWRHMNPITQQVVAAVRLASVDAGLRLGRSEREAVALVLGSGFGPASTGISFDTGFDESPSVATFARATLNAPAGEVCRVMGFRGPTTTVTSGAVSGTLAVSLAFELIRTGRADVAVAVASDEFFEHWLAARSHVDPDGLSPTGVPRPYDRYRDGTVLGSAAVALVLEAEEAAVRRSVHSYCEVLSTYHASDNYDLRGFDPSGTPFLRAMSTALRKARRASSDIGYCATWASGHRDDDIEARALSSMFSTGVPISAPKSLTGECESASGVINVLACSLALSEGLIPPTVNLRQPAPEWALDHVMDRPRVGVLDVAIAIDAAPGANFGAVVLGRVGG
jgi:3-oxoacyl-[acyl-carrier-protein] synthase II